MGFKEFIKNPGGTIWKFLDQKKSEAETSQRPEEKEGGISLADALEPKSVVRKKSSTFGFINSLSKLDWGWVLRGKTGLFLKIVIPLLVVISIVQPFITPRWYRPIDKPPEVDPGDPLQKPDFEAVNYINAVENDNNFLIYSSNLRRINEFGVRGIVLDSLPTRILYNFHFPLSKNSFLYLKDNKLLLYYKEQVINEKKESQLVDREVTIADNIGSIEEVQNLHKTADNNFAFTLSINIPIDEESDEILKTTKVFYVYDLKGNLIKEVEITDTVSSIYTYYGGEVYFVRFRPDITPDMRDDVRYSLVKLNSNDEEIYSQNLGEYRPHKVNILNENRFLVLFEIPSENSFFYVKMIDTVGNVLFQFTPKEEVQKITTVNSIAFDGLDNYVLLVGSGVAKLFDTKGTQLWIR